MNNVEFVQESHTYLYKGVVIPSVSELIRFKFPNQYKDVPKEILNRKASYGSKMHQYVEDFVEKKYTMEELQKKKVDPNIKIAVEQFERLRKDWCFQVEDMEQIVCWKGKFAGTYDMRTSDNLIIDLKSTSELHTEWLEWQLGLYYLALGIETNVGYCVWLPKGKIGKVVPIIPKTNEECKELIKEYEKHTSN